MPTRSAQTRFVLTNQGQIWNRVVTFGTVMHGQGKDLSSKFFALFEARSPQERQQMLGVIRGKSGSTLVDFLSRSRHEDVSGLRFVAASFDVVQRGQRRACAWPMKPLEQPSAWQ